MKGKNKILIIVLSILLLGCIGFIVFGFVKYNDLKKEKEVTCNTKTTSDTTEAVSNVDDLKYIEAIENRKGVRLHSIYSYGVIFSYDDNLYLMADHKGARGFSINDIGTAVDGELPTVGNPKVISNEYANSEITVYDLNVKASNVVKTVVKHLPTHRDITSEVFIIYKDGGLSNYVIGSTQIEIGKKYLTDYKIKDIEEKCSGEMCEQLTYILTLQDGTTKEVTSLE